MPPQKRKPQYMPGPKPKKRAVAVPEPVPQPKASTSKKPVEPKTPGLKEPWVHPYTDKPSIEILQKWLGEHGVWIHPSLDIRDTPNGQGIGIFSKGQAKSDEVVSRIPRSTVLSIRTASTILELVPLSTTRQIPSIVLLSLCLLYETRQGKLSNWYGYIQSLPRTIPPLVSLWPVENLSPLFSTPDSIKALEILSNTQVNQELQRISKAEHSLPSLQLYYIATSSYFPSTPTCPEEPNLGDFLWAYSMVSSRAFQVDVWHGMALVPFADGFNHKDPPRNHVHFESDDFVCPECGSLPACSHDNLIQSKPSLTPFSTSTPAPSSSSPSSTSDPPPLIPERLSHLPLEVITSYSTKEMDCLDMMCVRGYGSGSEEEIFNCYGENMGWAKMLCEWGFIDEESDERLGRGLKFDLKEVLRMGLDERHPDHEEMAETIYLARKKIWNMAVKKHSRGDFDSGPDYPENIDEFDWTFYPDDEDDQEPKDSLLINSDGKVSDWLSLAFTITALRITPEMSEDKSALEAEARSANRMWSSARLYLIDLALARERLDQKAPVNVYSVKEEVLDFLMQRLEDLVMERSEKTYKPFALSAELWNEFEKLGDDQPLSKMALKVLMEERRLLESVLEDAGDMRAEIADIIENRERDSGDESLNDEHSDEEDDDEDEEGDEED